jgi:hypothetical protein
VSHAKVLAIAMGAVLAATPLTATTYIVPSDKEMIQRADDIIVGTALSSHAEITPAGSVVTFNELRIERILKGTGRSGETMRIKEFGGQVGSTVSHSPGTPAYVAGSRYLIFTEMDVDGERSTWGVGLGQFEFRHSVRGRQLLVRGSGIGGFDAADLEPHAELARDAAAFLAFVEATVDFKAVDAAYFVSEHAALQPATDAVVSAFTRGSYLLTAGATAFFRHNTPAVAFVTARTQPSTNGPQSVDIANGQWNAASGGTVSFSRGAQDDTALGGQNPDGKQAVLFNDNGTFTSGAAGRAFLNCSGGGCITYMLDGEQFFPMTEVDVVISNSVQVQSCLNSVMTHEVGHTLGFRHADKNQASPEGACAAPLDCDSIAIMTAVTQCGFNGVLQNWDTRAVSAVYGSGTPPPCTDVSISSVSANPTTITQGETTTLTVNATGTAPLSYQWYVGTPPNTSNPVGGGNAASIVVAPQTTLSFWARVSNSCPSSMDSSAVTVTVNPPACPTVSVSVPTGQAVPGGVQLSVVASGGTSFTYQWFAGDTPGTGGTFIGSTNPITVNPSVQTSYWARATNQCGNSGLSAGTIVVTPPCTAPAIQTATASPSSINSGQTSTLTASATGTSISYQWYRGNPGDTSTPVGTGASVSVSPAQTATYWVRVSSGCGAPAANSGPVTVVVTTPCAAPSITQPPNQKISRGTSTTISVTASGTQPLTYQWFRGNSGDTSSPVGGNAAAVSTGVLQTTTRFWVRVTAGCGTAANSGTVTIEVVVPARRRAVKR